MKRILAILAFLVSLSLQAGDTPRGWAKSSPMTPSY